MSRSIQEELLSVLWFILALLLWRYEYKICSILALIKATECTIFSIALTIIGASSHWKSYKAFAALVAKQKEKPDGK